MDELMALLQAAADLHASDVYVLPQGATYDIWWRTTAGMQRNQTVPAAIAARWLNYLKYQAGMNIAEHRRVQLGAVSLPGLTPRLRLSTVGNFADQETLVIRLLYGIPPVNVRTAIVVRQLHHLLATRGMLALCGPTGAGKSALLYQVAADFAQTQMVMTIEDPVEIIHAAFLQLQVNEAAGQSYAALLKAALRHRPDVMVIGEIRDHETAVTACEAAVSGHIVLTTVHAKDARSVPVRLRSLGVAQSLIEAALVVSGAVRLKLTPEVYPEVEMVKWQIASSH
ncbi:ATPase, T2SS/T4P/T4SS family [Lacticaseibacillus nasuensis]|uniref:ATPase, T2SS/T4P/T4SS family n=1 Tax=Lacticaseibacillus nasuensis TaxID=944671 RepID=UPI002247E8C0|nr:ATPase, T2SS/T4P/T4SS family [Lacticaseibacillus nasuensis]MCX2455387.1 ATPase, T2SS/T4P/T4SS family [Lacticaseibacillus nasuensis]